MGNKGSSQFRTVIRIFCFRYQIPTMATGTRGQQDLQNLKTLVGPSKSFPNADLPSLRDILAAGMHIKEVSMASTKQHSIRDLCKELTDLLISLYSKANKEFLPGKNMMNRDTGIGGEPLT